MYTSRYCWQHLQAVKVNETETEVFIYLIKPANWQSDISFPDLLLLHHQVDKPRKACKHTEMYNRNDKHWYAIMIFQQNHWQNFLHILNGSIQY